MMKAYQFIVSYTNTYIIYVKVPELQRGKGSGPAYVQVAVDAWTKPLEDGWAEP